VRALTSQALANLFNTSVEMPVKNSRTSANQPLFMRFLPLCTAPCAALDIFFSKDFLCLSFTIVPAFRTLFSTHVWKIG
jgi:hypothetical protein